MRHLSQMSSKTIGSTVHRTLMGCSLAQRVHLLSKSPSSVKKLEIFLIEETSNIPTEQT